MQSVQEKQTQHERTAILRHGTIKQAFRDNTVLLSRLESAQAAQGVRLDAIQQLLPVLIDQQVSWQREATLAQGCELGGLRDGQQAIDIRVQSVQQKHSRHELAMAAHMQATADPRQVVCEYGAGMGIVQTDNRPASADDRLTGAANRGAQ